MFFSPISASAPDPDGPVLEDESRLSGALGNRLNSSVVEIPATVKNNRVNAGSFRALSDDFSDNARSHALGRVDASPITDVLLQVACGD